MKLQTDDGGIIEVLPLRGTIRVTLAVGSQSTEVTVTAKEARVIAVMLDQATEF